MVLRTQTGSGNAERECGEIKGKNRSPSPNNREIAKQIASESPEERLSALRKMEGSPKALAYVAATSEHGDIREAAFGILLKGTGNLFTILDEMTDRAPHPWERELARMVEEKFDPSASTDAKVLNLKAWQLLNSKAFRQSGSCEAQDGGTIEFVDESPVQFDLGTLSQILDETQA